MAISRKWQREISFMTHSRTFYNFLAHFFLTVPSPSPTKWQPPLTLPSLQMPTACSGCASCLPSSLTDLDPHHHHHTHPHISTTDRAMPAWAISISFNPAKQNKAGKDRLLPTQGSRGYKYSDILPSVKPY